MAQGLGHRCKLKPELDLALTSLVARQLEPRAAAAVHDKLAHRGQHRHLQLAQRVVRADVVVVKHAHCQRLALCHVRKAERLVFPHGVQVRAHYLALLRGAVVRSEKQHGVRIAARVRCEPTLVRSCEIAPLQQRNLHAQLVASRWRCFHRRWLGLAVLLQSRDELLRHVLDVGAAAALGQLLFEFAACALGLIRHELLGCFLHRRLRRRLNCLCSMFVRAIMGILLSAGFEVIDELHRQAVNISGFALVHLFDKFAKYLIHGTRRILFSSSFHGIFCG